MIKKSLFLLSLLLPLSLMAQLGVGSWQAYPTFQNVDQLIETPNKIYCLSAGSLQSYDMDTDESYSYGVNNVLTEIGIKKIYYNPAGKYLLVVYNSAGMDVLYDNGKMISLPDIKDAVLNTTPVINDVAFAPGKIIVATNFGLVIYDDNKMEVAQTGNYGKNVQSVGASDEYIVAISNTESHVWLIKMGERINNNDKFLKSGFSSLNGSAYSITGLKGSTFLIETTQQSQRRPVVYTYDFKLNKFMPDMMLDVVSKGVSPSKNGYYAFGDDKFVAVDADLNIKSVQLPFQLQKQVVAYWDDDSRLWAGDASGIGQYSIAGDQVSVLHDKIKGDNLTCVKVGYLHASPTGKIYISHSGFNECHADDWSSNANVPSYINIIHGGNIIDATPYDDNGKPILTSTFRVLEDPNDPDAFFVGASNNGLYKIKNNKVVCIYDETNSTIQKLYNPRYLMQDISFDGQGNLLTANRSAGPTINIVKADALKKATTAKADWSTWPVAQVGNGDISMSMTACKKSNTVAYSYKWSKGLYFIDTKGTAQTSDDVVRYISSFIDQDGKQLDFSNIREIRAIFEDSAGRLWIGYEQGVFIIPNPADFNNSNFRIQRIKVPRNDGTNYADYLLEGENVLCIAEDGIGHKWIGTQNSGAYLVNENGTEIIEHYNPDNSLLTVNTIYGIACDPASNAVYFGTVDGLFRYNSDSAPGAADYSEVYAYPNPVRPEYTGWITVKGLMDDSLVKIADAAGNVFHQGKSNGGLFIWDGCDSSGNRVKTGVYYVLASQGGNEGTSSSAAVTKILVVN